jgi:excisionase family DNA binding protein
MHMHRLNDDNPTLTVSQVARMLRCSARHVSNLCDNKALPSHRIGNDRRMLLSDVFAFASRNGIPMNVEDRLERAISDMRMRIDAESVVSMDMELHWRRSACALYRDAMREVFTTLSAKSSIDGSLVLDQRSRIRLLDLTRIARVADERASGVQSRAAEIAMRISGKATEEPDDR